MPAYDATRFDPPAPLARVTLRNLDTGAVCLDVPMLLDSGADVSLIPQTVMSQLGVSIVPDTRYELEGFDGSTSFAPVVQLGLGFCGHTFPGRFLLIDQEWGILGRNVVNVVPLLFDGPHLTWDEYRPGK